MHIQSKSTLKVLDNDGYTLKHALHLYESKSSSDSSLIIKFDKKKNGDFSLGVPVDQSEIRTLLSDVVSSRIEITPQQQLLDNTAMAVWWSKKQKRRMFIRSGNQRICLNVNHSSLIWKVNKTTNTLSVAAIANKRPDLNSKVYFAPLMNVHSNLSVCQGTARIPQFGTLSQSVIKSVEACLLDSNFTSLHFDALRNESNVASSKTNHVTFWKKKSLANQAPKLSELKIFGTLADFIRG